MLTLNKKKGVPRQGKVDVIYIRCDSNNPEYIKKRKKYTKQYNLDSYWSPTRDNQEILHSVISVRKYMKRVRNIFICAPKNHRVSHLDEKKYNVTYITNKEILGEENCPNFNSHSLELFTHKIPGLSNYFLQFNDDFFINQEVYLSDFYNFKTDKIKYYYEDILMIDKGVSSNTGKYINDMVGEKHCFWPIHAPRMFHKKDVVHLVEKYNDIVEYTKQAKFRTKLDFQLVHLYGYFLLSEGKGEFIFLKNITRNSFVSSFKVLLSKLFSEGLISVFKQIYFQLFYKGFLYKNKKFSKEEKYSMIHISNDYNQNKKNIDYILRNKVKFVCLNDSYSTANEILAHKIFEENYTYFYNKLLK